MSKDDMGAESKELTFRGSGNYGGSQFNFNAPIDHLKFQYKLGSKYNNDMKYDALVFEEQPFVIDVDV